MDVDGTRATIQGGGHAAAVNGPAGLGPAAEEGTASAYAALDAKRAGTASYTTGDLPSALERFEEAVAETPDDSEAQNNLGQILIRLGRVKDALPHFDAAVEIDGERWSYRFNRAGRRPAQHVGTGSGRISRRCGTLPGRSRHRLQPGARADAPEQLSGSGRRIGHAVEMAPGETSFLITLGTAYVGAKQPDRARATFETFLSARLRIPRRHA